MTTERHRRLRTAAPEPQVSVGPGSVATFDGDRRRVSVVVRVVTPKAVARVWTRADLDGAVDRAVDAVATHDPETVRLRGTDRLAACFPPTALTDAERRLRRAAERAGATMVVTSGRAPDS